MIRLTVLYNLPPDEDEESFVEWRLSQHQLSQGGIPGVVASSFHRITDAPDGGAPPYRFMTTADWPDRASFEAGFYDSQVQAKMQEDVKRIRDAVFLVSELLGSSRDDGLQEVHSG